MKKGQEYVTKGLSVSASEALLEREEPFEASPFFDSRMSSGLPRDYGMAGKVGAYEVPSLKASIEKGLRALAEQLTEVHPEEEVERALDVLLSPTERSHVTVTSVNGSVVTLSLKRRADRFIYQRTLLPRLKTMLQPVLGSITIRMMDRLS